MFAKFDPTRGDSTWDGTGEVGWTFGDLEREQRQLEEDQARLRGAVGMMAFDAGFRRRGMLVPPDPPKVEGATGGDVNFDASGAVVNGDGGALIPVPKGTVTSVKTAKYNGKVSWEAFHAQFELLAKAQNWSLDAKALQLAMCLTDDALTCLLLLDFDDRQRLDR